MAEGGDTRLLDVSPAALGAVRGLAADGVLARREAAGAAALAGRAAAGRAGEFVGLLLLAALLNSSALGVADILFESTIRSWCAWPPLENLLPSVSSTVPPK